MNLETFIIFLLAVVVVNAFLIAALRNLRSDVDLLAVQLCAHLIQHQSCEVCGKSLSQSAQSKQTAKPQ